MSTQSEVERAMLAQIVASPGLSRKAYWQQGSMRYDEAAAAARRLRKEGLVKTTGRTVATRWYPA